MIGKSKFLDYGFLLTLIAIPFIPFQGRIDIIGPQFLFMSISLLVYISLKVIFSKQIILNLNLSHKFFIGFIGVAGLSVLSAQNISEYLIELSRLTTIITYLILCYSILVNSKLDYKILLYFLLGFLFIETIYILKIFIDNYNFENPPYRLRVFQGLAYNQNVASLSILCKIPIVFYFLTSIKIKYLRPLLYLLLSISIFDLLIIGTRSALYGLIILVLTTIVLSFLSSKTKVNYFSLRKSLSVLILLIVISIFQTYLYQNSEKGVKVLSRVSNVIDESSNYRLGLWKDGINMLLEKPILGVGLGNYKIESLRYAKERLTQYEVPYHVHNDFIHQFVETGFIGGFLFLIFFLSPFYYFLVIKQKEEEKKKIFLFLTMSIFCIGIDYFFNFPKYRPYSLVNLISFFSIFFFLLPKKKDSLFGKKLLTVVLIINIGAFYVLNRTNNSFKEQFPLYVEYNNFPDQIITPIEEILKFEDQLPNISNVTIPMALSKARYLFLDGQYEKSKSYIKKGNRHNPYLGFGENLLTRIYLRENKLDSAAYFAKKSIDILPNSISHISYYQIILERLGDLEEIERIFEEKKHIKNEVIWQNYAIALVNWKLKKGVKFTTKDSINIKQAASLFPNSNLIRTADKVLDYGESSVIPIVNELDAKALLAFKQKEYEKSIDFWLRAIQLIPNDEAYYLNIAHAYILMDQLDKSLDYLNNVTKKGLKGSSGKYEFLLASIYAKRGNILKTCEFANIASRLGQSDASKLLQVLNCPN